MTLASTTSRVTYTGNNTTTAFSFPYRFLANSHLTVSLVSATGAETVQVLDSDYTVTGAGETAGGTVTMTTAPTSTQELIIERIVPITQATDLRPNDRFPAETVEQVFDKLTMIAQQLADRVGVLETNAFNLARTDDGVPVWSTLLSMANRKGKYGFFFDATTGDPELYESLGNTTISRSILGEYFYPQTAAEVAASVTPTYYYYEPGDVRRYGADPTGVADSTTAIESAMAAYTTVHFRQGTYLVDQITLDDDGEYCLIGTDATIKLKANIGGAWLYNDDTTFVERLELIGLLVNGNGANQTDWLGAGIDVHVAKFRSHGCHYYGFKGIALDIKHVAEHAQIIGNRFSDAIEHSGTLNENPGYVSLRSASDRAVSTQQLVSIQDNIFIGIDPSVAGRGPFAILAAANSGSDPDESHRLLVNGNFFYKIGQDAMGNKAGAVTLYRRAGRTIISDNFIYDSDEVGIDVQGSDNVIVADNLIHTTASSGIAVATRDGDKVCTEITIHHNILSAIGTTGIWVYGGSGIEHRNVTVTDNIIMDSPQAIHARYTDGNLMIKGNLMENITNAAPSTGDRCIDVYLCDGMITVRDNSLIDSENGFISVNGATGNVNIESNTADDCAETRPIRIVSVTGDVRLRGNTLTNVLTEVLRLDTITGRVIIDANLVPASSTISVASSATVFMSKANIGFAAETQTGAGAVSPFIPHTLYVSTGANALTLADGVEGQQKLIWHKTDGGAGTLTPTNLHNGTTITFTNANEWAELEFIDGGWLMKGGTAVLA